MPSAPAKWAVLLLTVINKSKFFNKEETDMKSLKRSRSSIVFIIIFSWGFRDLNSGSH